MSNAREAKAIPQDIQRTAELTCERFASASVNDDNLTVVIAKAILDERERCMAWFEAQVRILRDDLLAQQWNHNLSEAPQDAPIWLASKCGKVIKSQWAKTKTGGYWPGFKSDGSSPPIAWQPYIVPAHPGAVVQPMGVETGAIEFMAACDGVGGI